MQIIRPIDYETAKRLVDSGSKVCLLLNQWHREELFYIVLDKEAFDQTDEEQVLSLWVEDEDTDMSFASSIEELKVGEPVDYEEGTYMFSRGIPVKLKDWNALMGVYG